ncbi:hypothetical protein KR50_09300 [Jeotgalibacillus campisalis]|uniref:Uncharacterized protein n=1 Tax=Jeotgalibacillus campisalis TaxID=220754 RepID=A0A0C2SAU1_9BACL|nr:hypothetical protein KR50_09300 [Jeotgalibacillus campisalis]
MIFLYTKKILVQTLTYVYNFLIEEKNTVERNNENRNI